MARVGWIVVHYSGGHAVEAPELGPISTLDLPPGQMAALPAQGAKQAAVIDALVKHRFERGGLVVGATLVRFDDGTEWSYPLLDRRVFAEEYDVELHRRMTPTLLELRSRLKTKPSAAGSCPTSPAGVRQQKSAFGWLATLLPLSKVSATVLGSYYCDPYPMRECDAWTSYCDHWQCGLGTPCESLDCTYH